jgi:hypothetical protein
MVIKKTNMNETTTHADNQNAPMAVASGAVLGFVMDRMPLEVYWTIRIVIPGLDGGSAIWLETQFHRETRDDAEQMLDDIVAALKNLKREKRRDATEPNVES